MTLSSLHRKFLRHCEVEKRLAPQTITAYRSDFAQFLAYLLDARPSRQDSLRTFTTAGHRDYQRHMAARRWRTNTIRRRLVELGCFAAWLVDRGYLKRNPARALTVPKRERHLPRELEWHQAEAAVATEPHLRDRAILALQAAHHQCRDARRPASRHPAPPASLPPHLRDRAPQPPRGPPHHPDTPRARVARDDRGLHTRQSRPTA
jgi:hypothetical protein